MPWSHDNDDHFDLPHIEMCLGHMRTNKQTNIREQREQRESRDRAEKKQRKSKEKAEREKESKERADRE